MIPLSSNPEFPQSPAAQPVRHGNLGERFGVGSGGAVTRRSSVSVQSRLQGEDLLFGLALVHGYGWAHSTGPAGSMVSGGANGSRLRNPDHVVEHLSRDGGFTLLGRQDVGAQL